VSVEGRMKKYTRSMNLGRERSDSVGEGVLDSGKRKREMLGKESPEEGGWRKFLNEATKQVDCQREGERDRR